MSTRPGINDGGKRQQRKKGRKRGLTSEAVVRVLISIAKSEPKGMGIWDLTRDKYVKIKDRTTASKYCAYLVKEDWIWKKNKLAKYHITRKVLGDPVIRAYVFNNEIIRERMRLKMPESRPNKFTMINTNIRKDLNAQRIFSDESELFSFANRIGALITYACIEAVSPHRMDEKIAGWNVDEDRLAIQGKDRDKASRDWISHAINPDSIFAEFCRLQIVKRGQAIYTPRYTNLERWKNQTTPEARRKFIEDPAYRRKIERYISDFNLSGRKLRKFDPPHVDPNTGEKKGDRRWSAFELDADNFKKLRSAFDSVYPHLSKNLMKLRNALQKKISEEKEFRKSLVSD